MLTENLQSEFHLLLKVQCKYSLYLKLCFQSKASVPPLNSILLISHVTINLWHSSERQSNLPYKTLSSGKPGTLFSMFFWQHLVPVLSSYLKQCFLEYEYQKWRWPLRNTKSFTEKAVLLTFFIFPLRKQ